MGESIELRATIVSTASTTQRLVVDFVVHHVLANGSTAPKVFKWKTIDLAAHATATITKQRNIATATTRRYYPGLHLVQLQIAGQVVAETAFSVPVGSSTAENRAY